LNARRGRRAIASGALLVAAVTAAFSVSRAARAHDVGLSQSDFTMDGSVVRAHLVLAASDLEGLLDIDRDGRVTIAEVDAGRSALATLISHDTEVTAGGAPCPGTLERVSVEGVDGVALDATFACTSASGELSVVLHWLGTRPPGHRHVARLVAGKRTMSAVLAADHQGTSITLDAPTAPAPDSNARGVKERSASWWWWPAVALGATIALLGLRKLRYNRRP
jgi:hypothetical protein